LFFTYETPFEETGIEEKKRVIIDRFEHGSMPKLGTTVVDKDTGLT
jgi:hypothetical protein